MTINHLMTFKNSTMNHRTMDFQSIVNLKNIEKDKVLCSNPNSFIQQQLNLLYGSESSLDPEKCDLIILSEPVFDSTNKEEINQFIEDYYYYLNIAKDNDILTIHVSSSSKWFGLFEDALSLENIPVFLAEDSKSLLNTSSLDVINVNPYLPLTDFIHYSNEINKSLIIDLTLTRESYGTYKLNFEKLIHGIQGFDKVLVIINRDSTVPKLRNSNINIIYEDDLNIDIFKQYTYVYVQTEDPYSLNSVKKVIFYGANSKVVFTNYNYYLNNALPSIIMNLSRSKYDIRPFADKEAFDILNETRNTILFHYSFLNVLNDIAVTYLKTDLISPLYLPSDEEIDGNMFVTQSETENSNNILDLKRVNSKYDLEKTLLFPILFLGYESSEYNNNKIIYSDFGSNLLIPFYTDLTSLSITKKALSMIIPIHNNGKYLKYKCFNSILKLSCLDDIEIIFVNDGSSDTETIRIIKDLLDDYPSVVYHAFDSGSGSASRPRNYGMEIATGKYITFLDPDNEAIEDGYSILLNEMIQDSFIDMVVGNIIREDNLKRNEISYYRKLNLVQDTSIVRNTKAALLKMDLSVQSIQALIFKKELIDYYDLKMVEGAAGQDTLFFQELFIKCNKVKVLNTNIHSYYAYVEGSVTNTVTHKFFEKFFKVEKERIKFLESEGLIEHYMNVRFNSYMKNWYLLKYSQLNDENDKLIARSIINNIYDLYSSYSEYFDKNLIDFFENELSKN